MRRKICVVTGTRADYGIYYPILEKLNKDPFFDLQILVTGMHLSPLYGETIKEIEIDGFSIASKVDILLQNATGASMAKSVGLGIIGMTQALESHNPDLVLVLGDRGEMLSAAIAASHMNIPVAHIHGGEVSGSIDESVRHAITKLSHIHFPATKKSAERIVKMGEDSWRVHCVGAPRIDSILHAKLPDIKTVFSKYNIPFATDNYSLFVFHPVSTEVKDVASQIRECMETLVKTGKNYIIIMPNSDAGNDEIFKVYETYKLHSQFVFITNFSPFDYLAVLKHTNVLIGNSSSGIIEAASFKKPVINIGERQKGRERSANVVDTEVDMKEILSALEYISSSSFKAKLEEVENVYGSGNSSEQIVTILKQIDINDRLIKKIIAY